MTHAEGTCDATRCRECWQDETWLTCEVCGGRYEPDAGCQHDGHAYCPCCLAACRECRDAARWVG